MSKQAKTGKAPVWDYEEHNGEITLKRCKNIDGIANLDIPAVLDETPITKIDQYAFWLCESLVSVTIPGSVTEIGEGAFRDCESLKSVTIPDSVTEIGEGAFWGCESLASVTIPDSVSVMYIGEGAFYGCCKLRNNDKIKPFLGEY